MTDIQERLAKAEQMHDQALASVAAELAVYPREELMRIVGEVVVMRGSGCTHCRMLGGFAAIGQNAASLRAALEAQQTGEG